LNFIFTADIYNSRTYIANSSDNSGFSLIWFRKRDTRKNKEKITIKMEKRKNEKLLKLTMDIF
jgi:hypothetical protein